MAEKDADSEAEQSVPRRSKRKLLMLAGAAMLLAASGGATAWLLLHRKAGDEQAQAAPPRKTPVFVDLDVFTVNLPSDEAERFMQVKLVAEVRDSASGDMLKTMMPAVRNEILLLLGSKKAEDVATREGKEKLAQEIVLAANRPLENTPAANGIEHVNFTHLIVQ
jgi:flagellar FliL protein